MKQSISTAPNYGDSIASSFWKINLSFAASYTGVQEIIPSIYTYFTEEIEYTKRRGLLPTQAASSSYQHGGGTEI